MSSTALLTFYSPDWREVADLTRPNKEAYCLRHHYSYIEQMGPYKDPALYYAIDRLHFVKDLSYAYDTILVLNVPSLITNLSVSLESRIDQDHDFFIGLERDHVNAGCFAMRRSEWSDRFLAALIEGAPKSGAPWWENRWLIDHHQDPEWRDRVKVCEPGVIQSYPYPSYPIDAATPGNWRPGDFILGMPGLNMAQRVKLIKEVLPQVVS